MNMHPQGGVANRDQRPNAGVDVCKQLHPKAALEYVRQQGVVLASAKGSVPRLIEVILGEPIVGNWWSHPRGSFIYNVLAEVSDSEDVLVCRLLDGKVTLVHRRLWPALVRVSSRFTPKQIAQVHDEHTPSGRHVKREVEFPNWVPPEVHEHAAALTEEEALVALGPPVVAATAKATSVRGRQRKASTT